jgi:hypothetical protein
MATFCKQFVEAFHFINESLHKKRTSALFCIYVTRNFPILFVVSTRTKAIQRTARAGALGDGEGRLTQNWSPLRHENHPLHCNCSNTCRIVLGISHSCGRHALYPCFAAQLSDKATYCAFSPFGGEIPLRNGDPI